MNVLSLCSGIGGLDLGLKIAVPAARTVCYVEFDGTCQDLLDRRVDDGILDAAPVWGDLRLFDAGRWRGVVDTVIGGYPCQPFSTAGSRRGAEDPRHLWPHIAAIVEAVEPEWCLFENVAGHLSLGSPEVVRDLVGMGYRVALGLFTASELGAPHERERLFILAHADCVGPAPAQDGGPDADGPGGGRAGLQSVGGCAEEARGEEVGPAASRVAAVGYPGAWPPPPGDPAWRDVVALDPSLSPGIMEGGQPRLNPGFVEWLMGFPRGWTAGIPREARLRMLGNAVVPAVAALAWKELSADLSRAARVNDAGSDAGDVVPVEGRACR